MSNRTAWTAGNGQGLSWGTAINGSDLASLASGSTVLSSVADIANGTYLDQFADISVELTISSATPSAGAVLELYLAALLGDGSTYGSGEMSSGGVITRAPALMPVGTIPLQSSVATTLLAGFIQGIVLPPGSFRFALYNGSGITLSSTAGNNAVKYRTYNQNLNN